MVRHPTISFFLKFPGDTSFDCRTTMSLFNSRMNQLFPVTDDPHSICIDSVQLVREVKKHPIIYDSLLRRDQFANFAAWETILGELLPNFELMSEADKSMIRKRLRLRWSWMRSTLRRDLTRNRMQCHRHLKWMQEMHFLVPLMLNRANRNADRKQYQARSQRTTSESSSTATSNIVTSTTAQSSTFDAISPAHSPTYSEFVEAEPPTSTKYTAQPTSANDTQVKAFITSFGSDAYTSGDQDKNFLFAMLHVFRKVKSERKPILRSKFSAFVRE